MRNFTRLLLLFFALLPALLFANVYVHGYVKYANGAPAAGVYVTISSDSAVAQSNCQFTHYRVTNSSGFYADTLVCPGTITQVKTWIRDVCNTRLIIHNQVPNANSSVESNFITCDSASTFCYANFIWQNAGTSFYFSSAGAFGASAMDSIISRTWTFGDGTSLAGNVVNPTHVFTIPGTFNVCLKIRTVFGCESTQCQTVLVGANTACQANFSWSLLATARRIGFNSSTSTAIAGDSIISRKWRFGDGDSLIGNVVSPEHTYRTYGTYSACLTIRTRLGCEKTFCSTVNILNPNPTCHASFTSESIATPAGGTATYKYKRFISTSTTGQPDSIITAKWTFGDGAYLITNSYTRPTHGYAQVGNYTVCLIITSAGGCIDSTCQVVMVRDSTPNNTDCQPRFATTANGLLVTFNANTSTTATGDSVISRSWNFGDGVTINGNAPVLTHQYPRASVYQACLTIRTRLGCTSTTCKTIAVVTVSGNCVPFFTKEQVTATPKTIRFNSSAAYSQIPNGSIIARKWEFGDGQVLLGNVVNPLHTYLRGGTYTACLTIYTAHCDKRWCQTIQVLPLDSTNTSDSVGIVSLYPVPVTSPLNVLIHSAHPNVNAQLAIYDVYGVLKSTQSVVLPLGNSNYSIPTAQLAAGPYIFKLTTIYGVKSRSFYKL